MTDGRESLIEGRLLELIKVRQMGSGVVHLAHSEGLTMFDAMHWNYPVTAVVPPIATVCRATLRGETIRIPDIDERGYRVTCKTCLLLAEV